MVLLAVMRLGDTAYGVTISHELEDTLRRNVSISSIYNALERLEAKGFVSSELGDPTPERGGRAKRFFKVTPPGAREARSTRKALTTLWGGIPQVGGERA